jgi:hypothetical protein
MIDINGTVTFFLKAEYPVPGSNKGFSIKNKQLVVLVILETSLLRALRFTGVLWQDFAACYAGQKGTPLP